MLILKGGKVGESGGNWLVGEELVENDISFKKLECDFNMIWYHGLMMVQD